MRAQVCAQYVYVHAHLLHPATLSYPLVGVSACPEISLPQGEKYVEGGMSPERVRKPWATK